MDRRMTSVEEPRRAGAAGVRTELDVGARTEIDVGASRSDALPESEAEEGRLRGVRIGRYVLLTKLGEGGMGVVWAAYDPELDRRLALKVLRRAGDSDRLLREAQALARLAHPNVVAIHDVGEDDGDVWLAMELVDGQTLDVWSAAEPGRSWREILGVLLPAGHGVAAAHGAGLIHRDLKPENLMIGADGRARVMDFGLARAGELVVADPVIADDPLVSSEVSLLSSSVTRAGAIVGTPLYMAPEQFGGAVDERSDLFAFCVVLWEALYGARPFAGDNLVSMVYAITQGAVQEAPRGRSAPRWLRRVLLRGLQGAPEARWQSMAELLAAIEGGLARERWRRLAILVAVLGAVVLGILAWGFVEERRQRSACADEAASIAALWPGQAPEAFAAIHRAGIGNADETVEKLAPVLDAWAEGWSESRERLCLGGGEGSVKLDPQVMLRALDCSDLQRDELRGFLEILNKGDQRVVLHTIKAALSLSKPSRCQEPEHLRLVLRPEEGKRAEVQRLRALLGLAQTMIIVGSYTEARTLVESTFAEAERLAWPPLLASAEVRVGHAIFRDGGYADAEEWLRRGLRRALEVGDAQLTVESIYHLAYVAHEIKDPERGMVWLDVADGLLRRDDSVMESLGLQIRGIRAVLLQDLGRLAEADEIYRGLLPQLEELYGEDSLSVVPFLNNAALLRAEQGDVAGARQMHERAQAVREELFGPNHPRVASSLMNRGLTYMRGGDFKSARPLYERALAIQERAFGKDDPRVAATLNVLSVTLSELEEFEAATAAGERVLAIRKATFGDSHVEYASALNNHAVILAERKMYREAEELHLRALEIRQAHFGDEGNEVARSHTNLGELAMELGDLPRAIEHLERAVAIRESIEVSPISLAYSKFALARAIAQLDPDRAKALAKAALEAYEASEHARVAELRRWIEAHDGRSESRGRRTRGKKGKKGKMGKMGKKKRASKP